MPGLLFPAYQKFYSALSSLDRFNKEANFFDNTSCIDNFFSEYRNITFAIQSQLAHTRYSSIYETNRDKYLTDHWFIEKRNETTKQKPFQLIKEITITLFLPFGGFKVMNEVFTVEDDEPLDSLIDGIKGALSALNAHEVFLSATFRFHEANSDIDLLDKVIHGINTMKSFMTAMDQEIGEDCPLCNQLKDRIRKIGISIMPYDMLLTNDYVYYPPEDRFEKAERQTMTIDGDKIVNRKPLSILLEGSLYNYDGTVFGSFTKMHAFLRTKVPGMDPFPAIMTVFSDGTFNLEAFGADIKTTMYRKLYETAKVVSTQDVIEVCFMGMYSTMEQPKNEPYPEISKERLKLASFDMMVCASVDKDLNEKEYVFHGKEMERMEYVVRVMNEGPNKQLFFTRSNLFPIWYAFKQKKDKQSAETEEQGRNLG